MLGVGIVSFALLLAGEHTAHAQEFELSLPGFGEAGSTGILQSFGASTESVRLAVPPARQARTPELGLQYTSLGGLTELGQGWSLPVGRVTRATDDGTPSVGDVEEFLMQVGGAQVTLFPVGGGRYRPRIEDEHRSYRFDGTTWTMVDNSGRRYVFGASEAGRVGDHIWALEEIVDPNGNAIELTYLRDRNELYVATIRYTAHRPTGSPGASRIAFEYEARPDVRLTYRHGVRQRQRLRIAAIAMFRDDALVRRYELDYAASPSTDRSLLTRVDLVGADGTTRETIRTYAYTDALPAWRAPASLAGFPANLQGDDGKDLGVRVADVNGDGFADVVDDDVAVFLGDGGGAFALDATWTASIAGVDEPFVNSDGVDRGVRLQDVNGDARPDIFVARGGRREVHLNTGRGWAFDEAYSTSLGSINELAVVARRFLDPENCIDVEEPDPTCEDLVVRSVPLRLVQDDGDSSGVLLGDANGDGRVDLVWSFATTETLFDYNSPTGNTVSRVPVAVTAVYLNDGDGWTRSDELSDALASATGIGNFVVDSQVRGYELLDLNGDGMDDVVRLGADEDRSVFLATGSGWQLDLAWTVSIRETDIVNIDGSKSQGLLPVDLDADGLVDFVRADEGGVRAYVNTGLGVTERADLAAPLESAGLRVADSSGRAQGVTLADVDGDGRSDLVQVREGGPSRIFHGRSGRPDLLAGVGTSLGERVAIEYVPSSTFDHVTASGIHGMPAVLPVPRVLVRRTGRGPEYRTEYEYAGGLLDEDGFRGFGVVEERWPEGDVATTRFEQDDATKGRVAVFDIADADGTLLSRKTTTYDVRERPDGSLQPLLVRTDESVIDGSDVLRRVVLMAYDDHMNVIEAVHAGDPDDPADDARMVHRYVSNPAVGITGLPMGTTVYGHAGEVLSDSRFFYDDLAWGAVTRGNMTSTEELVAGGRPYTSRMIEYDDAGNVLRMSDREGNVSSFEYDDSRTFRVRATDPLGRVIEDEIDSRFGVALGQIDHDGNEFRKEYDAFGRLVVERAPGDECTTNGTVRYDYAGLGGGQAGFVRILRTETPGGMGSLDTEIHLDGLGRTVRRNGEGTEARVVTVTYEHDSRGRLLRQSLPHHVGEPAAFITYDRDALGRVVRSAFPDGRERLTTYHGPRVERTDGRGHRTVLEYDAYRNVVGVHELDGTTELVTRRAYDGLQRLVEVQRPDGGVVKISYDGLGRRTRLEDPTVGVFTYRVDANGALVEQVDPQGRSTTFEYDAAGDMARKVLPDGETIEFELGDASTNSSSRLRTVWDALGTIEIEYDARGNVTQRRRTVDDVAYVTGFDYDSLGRVTRVIYPDGATIAYQYNEAGSVASIVDEAGRPLVTIDGYTAAGHVTSITYGNGVRTAVEYDELERLAALDTDGVEGESLQAYEYTYDGEDNLVAIDDASGEWSQAFSYDALNRIASASGAYGSRAYRYDVAGNLVQNGSLLYQVDDPRTQRVRCAIDLSLATDVRNGLASRPGLVSCANAMLSNPLVGSAERTQLQEILREARPATSQIGRSIDLGYDGAGNVTARNGRTLRYDTENRLVSVESEAGVVLQRNHYDGAGRRVVREEGSHRTIYIDGLFEVVQHGAHGGVALKHVRIGERAFATIEVPAHQVRLIDARPDDDPLTECSAPLAVLESRVGAMARAAGIEGGAWSAGGVPPGGIAARVLLAASLVGLALFAVVALVRARRRVRAVVLELGTAWVSTFTTTMRAMAAGLRLRPGMGTACLVLAALQSVGCSYGPIDASESGLRGPKEKRAYYHPDHAGNIEMVTNDDGEVVQHRRYLPFGEQFERVALPPDLTVEFAYNAQVEDSTTGFSYFGARYYDAALGRFLTPDTVVGDDAASVAYNRYAFGANNPIRFTDPTGRGVLDIILGIILAVVAVVAAIVSFGTSGAVSAILAAVAIGIIAGAALGAIIGAVLFKAGVIDKRGILSIVTAGALLGMTLATGIGMLATLTITPAVQIGAFALFGATVGGAVGAGIVGRRRGFDEMLNGLLIGFAVGAAMGALATFSAQTFYVSWVNAKLVTLAGMGIGYLPGSIAALSTLGTALIGIFAAAMSAVATIVTVNIVYGLVPGGGSPIGKMLDGRHRRDSDYLELGAARPTSTSASSSTPYPGLPALTTHPELP